MLRLPANRILNLNACRPAFRLAPPQAKSFSSTPKQLWQTPVKALSKPTLGASKIITLAAFSGASLLFKKPVQCQAAFATEPFFEPKVISKPLLNKGELTFGTFLGICTGFLIKKVGKIFAAFVGTGFVFLQYLAQQGYITVNWERMEGGYKNTLGVDKDGRVSTRDLQSKWQKFMNLLTSNIQFKSTFLVGFYAGMRYG